MALRVLLADESSTIKKVFQLALQDFGVEVRPVNIGVDVASVAAAFKPDIIFADVLLQKKNGYDVCSELKSDAQLRSIPIVLMWSGFMELDEDKLQAAQANAQLEKPFDVQALRKLVTDLVPRTRNNNLAQFLTFPKATVEAEKPAEMSAGGPAKSEEDFQQLSIPKMKGDKYRLNLKAEELDPKHIAVEYQMPADKIEAADVFADDELKMKNFRCRRRSGQRRLRPRHHRRPLPLLKKSVPPPVATKAPPLPKATKLIWMSTAMNWSQRRIVPQKTRSEYPPMGPVPAVPALTAEQLEKIIREQSAEVIEAVVWKVIPELAAQIIERELNKLLKERDSHPY